MLVIGKAKCRIKYNVRVKVKDLTTLNIVTKNKNFMFFLVFNLCIFIGEKISSIILPIILYTITGNIYSTGLLMLSRFLPKFISNYAVKKFSDLSLSLTLILKVTAIIRMCTMALFIFAFNQWHYYILTFVLYFNGALSYPYNYALIAKICNKAELPKANNILALLDNSTMLTIPILGSFIYSYLGMSAVMIIAILFLFIALLCLSQLDNNSYTDIEKSRRTKEERPSETFMGDIRILIGKHRLVFLIILVDVIASIAFGSLNTVLPILVQQDFNNSAKLYSYLTFSLSLGLITGNIIFHKKFTSADFLMSYIVSTIFATLFFMFLGFSSNYNIYIALLFFIGICNSVQDSSLVTEIQNKMEGSNLIPFIFSIYQSLAALLILMSTLLVPFMINNLGTTFLFLFFGSVNIIGLVFLLFKRRVLK